MKFKVNSFLYALNPESFDSAPVDLFKIPSANLRFNLISVDLVIQRLSIVQIIEGEDDKIFYTIKPVIGDYVIYEDEDIIQTKLDSQLYFLSFEDASIFYLKKILKIGLKLFSLNIGHHSLMYTGSVAENTIIDIKKDGNNELIYEISYYSESDRSPADYTIRKKTELGLIRDIINYNVFLTAESATYYYLLRTNNSTFH